MIRPLPFLLSLLALVAGQAILTDLLFGGRLRLELLVVAAIFAGFYLPVACALPICFVLGYATDILAASVAGVHTLAYVIIYLMARLVTLNIYRSHPLFLALFTFLCLLGEGLFQLALSALRHPSATPATLIPTMFFQALLAGALSPVILGFLKSTLVPHRHEQRRLD